MSVVPIINLESAEAFGEAMLQHLTGASVSMMASIGHRTGLFDVLSTLPFSTSSEIAAAAGLQERYVREWLAAMVTAGVIRYEPKNDRYLLPSEHAVSLTRAAGAENLATLAQLLSAIGTIEDELVDAFRSGGGVPYDSCARFQEVMSDTGDQARARAVESLEEISPALVQRLESGIDVLEIGCGRGYASLLLARRFPRSRFLGADFSQEAIAFARARALESGLENLRFEVADAAQPGAVDRYGLVVTFDAIHDQAKPEVVLENIQRSLRRGGFYLMVEPAAATGLENNLDHPLATLLYTISTFHCLTVSLAQNGRGLGTMWGQELALQMLAECGFSEIGVRRISGDLLNSYFLSRKS